MKKLVIIIATLAISFPFIFQEENYSFSVLSKKTEEFFASSSQEIISSGQAEFNRVIEKTLKTDNKNETELLPQEINGSELTKKPIEKSSNIIITVPFSAQAPLGDWSDPRQQDACEEVGVIMAMAWVNNRNTLDPLVTQQEIIALADWQQEKYGEHRDLHISEVASRLFGEYFNYHQFEIKELVDKGNIIQALNENKIILAPTNGQVLSNPHFTPPGPERHLIVIIGYDLEADEFITNDPGTRYGASYRYQTDLLFKAISAYPSGFHETTTNPMKLVLLISK